MSINEIVDMYDKTGVLAAQEAYTILVDGYNFRTDKYCNLYEQGVIDPTKVLRVALENAVSITCQLLTTEAIVKNKMTEFDLANINQPKNMVNPIYH
jgi:chaperonin GroEL (HSP60 family)